MTSPDDTSASTTGSPGTATPRSARPSMRLSTRIHLGMGIPIALFLVSVMIARYGFRDVEWSIDRFAEASHFATDVDAMERDALAARQYVLTYTFGGVPSDAERVADLASQLDDRIVRSLADAPDDQSRDHLERMRNHLGTYRANFETVVEERRLRDEVIRSRVIAPSAEIKRMLGEVVDGTREGMAPDLAQRVLANASLAEMSALQFVNDPDSGRVREGLAALRNAIDEIESHVDEVPGPLLARLKEVEAGFLRSVQATRGFLYLAHVVMAGEAAEFAYHSRAIRQLAEDRLRDIRATSVTSVGSATNLVLGVSLIAVLIGFVVSFGIVRRTVGPIEEITRTFGDLSEGRIVETVPALERGDEIGEMARAADVFRQRNRQTLELLDEARRLADELDQRADQLAQSNRDLDSFAYIASHDLKSPLRGIDSLAEWILEDAGDALPEESRDHLHMLRGRVGRMERLLNDLLSYSRAGREGSETTTVDVRNLVEETRDTIDWPPGMTLELAPDLPVIETVAISLQRVFHNLLTNAVKYRADDPHVEVRWRPTDSNLVEFSVIDNGIGIAPEYHAQVFEMFKRLHSRDEIEGSGMGLALVKRLVESNGGRIRVDSELGSGATFTFTWPNEASVETRNRAVTAGTPLELSR